MLDRSRLATLALILTVAGYPLAAVLAESMFGADNGRLITVPYRTVVALVSIQLIMSAPLGPGRMRHLVFWASWWSFWLLYIARMLLDTLILPVELPQPISEYLLYGVGTSFLPAVGLAVGARFFDALRAPRVLLIFAGLASFLTVAYILSMRDVTDFEALASARLESAMVNPISLGHVGATTIILAGWWLMWGRGRKTETLRILLLGMIAIGSAALVAGSSRGPFLALVAACAMLVVAQRLVAAPLIAASGVAALLATVAKMTETPLLIVERLTEGAFDDRSRELLIEQAWHAFLKSPMIGVGIDALESYPHNLIVEAYAVNGAVLGTLFVVLLVSSLWISFQTAAMSRTHAWLPALYVQYAVAVMFSGNLYGSNIFWCLMAATVAWSHVPVSGMQKRRVERLAL